MSDYSQILKREAVEKKDLPEEKVKEKVDKKENVSNTWPKEEQTGLFSPAVEEKKPVKRRKRKKNQNIVWVSLTDSASLCGVQSKTLRRAIKAGKIRYKIVHNRYYVDFESLMLYLAGNSKLKNKFKQYGIGQYIGSWKIGYKI